MNQLNKNILIIICSRSPNKILHSNIIKLKQFYNNSKIIVIDSDSSDFSVYKQVKDEFNVELHALKNGISVFELVVVEVNPKSSI